MRSKITIYAALIIAVVSTGAGAQDKVGSNASAENVAPIKWRRYEVAERKISFIFPKLPVVNEDDSPCEEIDGAIYRAYAAQVVYEFAWYARRDDPMPEYCKSPKNFGPQSYLVRLANLREESKGTETTAMIGTRKATVLQLETPDYVSTRWLIWSIDDWVEMKITRRKENLVDEEKVLKGIEFRRLDGVPIGTGSGRTVGDLPGDIPANVKAPTTARIALISRPLPVYTDEARANNVHGTVTLKVTFLANGTIGPIMVVKPSTHGMTEQTVAAARGILFLPKTENGVPVDSIENFEYHFRVF